MRFIKKRTKTNLDWLEQEWYDKFRNIGHGHEEAVLLGKIKATIERDSTFGSRISKEGFDGFCRWVELNCKEIYDNIKGGLRAAWDNYFKELFK